MSIFDNIRDFFSDESSTEMNTPQQDTPVLQDDPTGFLDTFQKDNWNNASYQERMDAYQSLEHYMAEREGRAERQIVFGNMDKESPGAVGYYTSADDRLHMDTGYLTGNRNPYDGMDTVIHEGRHAYQADAMNGYVSPDERLAPHMQGLKDNEAPTVY